VKRLGAAFLLVLPLSGPVWAQSVTAPAEAPPAVTAPAPAPATTAAVEVTGPVVAEVKFAGLQRTDALMLEQNVDQTAGLPLDPATVAGDIRRMFKLDYFADIRADAEPTADGRVILTYSVVEQPLVRAITFSGNDEIEDEKIKESIDLKPRTFLREKKLREIQEKIRAQYLDKGYNFTQVYYDVKRLPNNEVSVNFRIEENLKVYVHSIRFVGNRVYDEATLKGLLETSEYEWYSFLGSGGVFKEGVLDREVEALSNLYLNNGYIKVRVAKPKAYLSSDRKWVDITFEIDEGPQYFVGEIKFSGDLIFSEPAVREKLHTRKPLPFSRERLSGDVQMVSEKYQDIGFAFVAVSPLTDVDEEHKLVNIDFSIDKGELVYVNKIVIRGNTKTRDKVVRRELLITEGQLFNGSDLRNSRARVFALGFFEEVNFKTEPSPAGTNKIDVIVDVKERATGTLSAGVGYNSLDRFLGIAQVSFGNLGGYGIRLNVQAEFGASRQFYTISYTDPYFLDTKWSLGGDINNSNRDYGQYTQTSVGGSVNAGYLVYLDTRVYANYRYEKISLGSFTGGGSDFFRTGATGSLGASFTRNTKDHPYDTTKGYVLSGGVEWANPSFGGDYRFVKYNAQTTYFYNPFWLFVLSTHEEVAWGRSTDGGRLPFTERYFLGGITSLRGFNYRQIGPRVTIPGASRTDFFPPIEVVRGGNKMIAINNELVFPIIPQAGIKGVLFFDAGNAYAEEEAFLAQPLRLGTGFGIRWFSPIGPLRFEWGFPIRKKADERKMVFEFSIGTFF
jgi:outer membrane protein insertion porin family